MKRLSKNKLREMGIYNSHDIARISEQKLFIAYFFSNYGKVSICAKWQVYGMGFKTDPKAAWDDYEQKTFNVQRREDNSPQLVEAIKWCAKNYGITEWEKDPFGDYQVKGAIELAINRQLRKIKK